MKNYSQRIESVVERKFSKYSRKSFFCIIPNTKLAFVVIPKNGVTFLKRLTYYNTTRLWLLKNGKYSLFLPKEGPANIRYMQAFNALAMYLLRIIKFKPKTWLNGQSETHHFIGYNTLSPYLIPISEMPAYEAKHGKFIKFAIWRDPIDRITSAYKFFCLEKSPHTYYQEAGVQGKDFDTFMEFLQEEWAFPPIWHEIHIRSQATLFTPQQVDYIVHIKDMHAFLAEHNVPFVNEVSNKTTVPFKIENDAHIQTIKGQYKADYLIPITYKTSAKP